MQKEKNSTTLHHLRNKTLSDLQQLLPAGAPSHLTTEELARFARIKPGTIRRALCELGHYGGITPLKMGNGRLLWPVA
ncbi:MAG: hypothetical protein JZU65_23660 [Chlorobium sp.]|nr:hypothetical protein [Chlorobium sp.]